MNAEDELKALNVLLRAERAGDERAADMALDRMLELAASAAGPDPLVRAQVEHALGAALGTSGTGAMAGTRAGWLQSGWARAGSKLGLVTVGVAIGFVWGRSPEWRAERGPEPAEAAWQQRVANAESPAVVEVARAAAPLPSTPVAAPERVVAFDTVDTALTLETHAAAPASSAPAQRSRAGSAPPRATRLHATRAPGSATRSDSASDDTLRIALEQLRKAQLFLSASEPARALAALDELDARVPAAVLSDEREVTRALALCKTGDAPKAAALAARVLQRAPDSAYALSLRESCAGQELLVEQMRERTSNRAE